MFPLSEGVLRRTGRFLLVAAALPLAAVTVAGSTVCEPDDTWSPLTTENAPDGTAYGSVWTGSLWIVWGSDPVGHRYDPAAGTWSSLSTVNAPDLDRFQAIWTGKEVLLVGDRSGIPSGARYDPETDTWGTMSETNAPYAYYGYSMVWTGNHLIVWGGRRGGEGPINRGTRYDPVSDTWTPLSTDGAPSNRQNHSAVWTGSRMILWGGWVRHMGIMFNDGAAYDPVTDTWAPISMANAPSPRFFQTAVWTGDRMLIWGGGYYDPQDGALYNPATDTWTPVAPVVPAPPYAARTAWTGRELIAWGADYDVDTDTYSARGARYDPATETWTHMSGVGAPEPRYSGAVGWIGTHFAVWGGYGPGSNPTNYYQSGFLYAVDHAADVDGDGTSLCAGDCDDIDPLTHPGAPEVCDGRDNDCDGALPGSEADADGDGSPVCADCDDAHPLRFPGGLEYCDNVDNDCDGAVDGISTTCGVGACASVGLCVAGVDDCQPGLPAAEVCDGLDNDCDGLPGPGEEDVDGDGFGECAGDCDIYYGLTYPGAPEYNDGLDNQCYFSEPGYGLVDELSGSLSFPDPTHLCWPSQLGASKYEVLRTGDPSLASPDCFVIPTSSSCADTLDPPALGELQAFLVRPLETRPGSWGAGSSGMQRQESCVRPTISFVDTASDDLPTNALEVLFSNIPIGPEDYLYFSVGPPGAEFEICTERADFYAGSYVALAQAGGQALSGSWNKWTREGGGTWSGPVTTSQPNTFGDYCSAPYAWCIEEGLGGHFLGVSPIGPHSCEAFDSLCSGDTPSLTIRVAGTRLESCGF